MYFGSVRFFKHLLITIILLLIIIPIVLCVTYQHTIREQNDKIEKLLQDNNALLLFSAHYNLTGELDSEDIYNILSDIGIDNKEIINKIYEKDKSAFDDIDITPSYPEETAVDPDPPKIADNTEESSTSSGTISRLPESGVIKPYMELYPDLYSGADTDVEYAKDDDYIYLTFDDGPSSNTPMILDYLAKYDIEATFFVIPKETEKSKEYLNRILNSGHALGIHTFSHDYKEVYKSVESYLDDFNQAYTLVYEQTGFKPFLFRFPGGSRNDYNEEIADEIIEEMTRRGFVYFDWNVDSGDALGANWTEMFQGVQEQVNNQTRSVILFHDGPGNINTVYVIEDIISVLSSKPKNYKFSAIYENTRPMHF